MHMQPHATASVWTHDSKSQVLCKLFRRLTPHKGKECMNPEQTGTVELRVCCSRALHFSGTSRSSILRFYEFRTGEVTAAEQLRSAVGQQALPQRTSLQHIWSLSIVHQVSFLVAHRRIKTTRSSLLFNYSITQKETVITWNITKSRRVRSVLRWRRAGANWQHLQTLLRRLCEGGRSVREMRHSAARSPSRRLHLKPRFSNIWRWCDYLSSASAGVLFLFERLLFVSGHFFLLFISSTAICTSLLFQPVYLICMLVLTPQV